MNKRSWSARAGVAILAAVVIGGTFVSPASADEIDPTAPAAEEISTTEETTPVETITELPIEEVVTSLMVEPDPSPAVPLIVVADTTKPTTSVNLPTPATPGAAVWISATSDIVVTASDETGLSKIVGNIYKDGVLYKSSQIAVNGALTGTLTIDLATLIGGAPLADGSNYFFRYNALDTSGNLSLTSSPAFKVDSLGPIVTPKVFVEVNGYAKVAAYKIDDRASGCGYDYMVINGVKYERSNNRYGDANDLTTGEFSVVEGSNTALFYDCAGNFTEITFKIDTTGPTLSVKASSNGSFVNEVWCVADIGAYDASGVAGFILPNGVNKPVTVNAYSDHNGLTPGVDGATEGVTTIQGYDALGNLSSKEVKLDCTNSVLHVPTVEWASDYTVFNITQEETFPDFIYAEIQKKDSGGIWRKVTGTQFKGTNTVAYDPSLAGLDESGEYQLKVTSRDLAGHNVSATSPFKLDLTGPVVYIKDTSVPGVGGNFETDLKAHDALSGVDFGTLGTCEFPRINDAWTDFNDLVAGTNCVVLGENPFVATDVAGNPTTFKFNAGTAIVPPVENPEEPIDEPTDPEDPDDEVTPVTEVPIVSDVSGPAVINTTAVVKKDSYSALAHAGTDPLLAALSAFAAILIGWQFKKRRRTAASTTGS